MPQLLDADDHRSGSTADAGPRIIDRQLCSAQDGEVTTPFDDPQAELAWMFLQFLSDDGDVDECFDLLSDDFTYWSNISRDEVDKAGLRDEFERRKRRVELSLDLVQCFNDGESVVIEAETDGETADGLRYSSPAVFIFETRDGLIVSLREYSDTQLAAQVFGPANP
jgi:ketosteroid isomerase-like protein